MDAPTSITLEELVELLNQQIQAVRHVTAIVGPPAAGKSTLCKELERRLNDDAPGCAAVVAMDGFHFDDHVLKTRGSLDRKGAPHTFDVSGLRSLLARLRTNEEDEVAVPVFDRELELARNAASIIPRSVRHIIVEGNYLLLKSPPWDSLMAYFDTTVAITVSENVLERRLRQRWQDLPADVASQKITQNDLVNARLVVQGSRQAQFELRQ